MDDLKTRIRTTQCEFEIQLERTARLAQQLTALVAQLAAEDAAQPQGGHAYGKPIFIWNDKD